MGEKTRNNTKYCSSYYLYFFKENSAIFFFSLFLAVVCTIISYPGVWYSDSYSRVYLAEKFISSLSKYMINGDAPARIDAWLTYVPSLFMAFSKGITGSFALYTCLQAFAFFAVTFLLVKRLNGSYRIIQYLFWALIPMIFCVSVWYEPGIGCITGLVALTLFLDSDIIVICEKSKLDYVIELLLLFLFSFIMIGYRANAFTVIPVFIIYIWFKNFNESKKLFLTSVLIAAFFTTSTILPKVFNINTMSSINCGFVWEIVTIIKRIPKNEQNAYIDYLDDIGGKGATALAIQKSDENSVNGFLWTTGLNPKNLSQNERIFLVLKKYIGIALNEYSQYLSVKLEFTKKPLVSDITFTLPDGSIICGT